MGIFDALSGGAYDRAAKANGVAVNNGLRQAADGLSGANQQAEARLGSSYGGNALGALQAGYGRAASALQGASGQTQGYLGQIGDTYAHELQGGQSAYDHYLNATGANGAAGSAQAAQDFTASPGYQYNLDQQTGQIERTAAARGQLGGGNTTDAILERANGLASQGYQNYVSNLGNAASSYQGALGGTASGLGLQANAAQTSGQNMATVGNSLGTSEAGVYGQGASLLGNYGTNLAGLQTGAANQIVNSNNVRAQGQTQASGNLLGGIAGLATSALGGFGSSGGLGNIGSLFGGGSGGNSVGGANFSPFKNGVSLSNPFA